VRRTVNSPSSRRHGFLNPFVCQSPYNCPSPRYRPVVSVFCCVLQCIAPDGLEFSLKTATSPVSLRPRPVSGSQRPFSVLVKLSRTRISLVPNRYRPSPVKSPVNRFALAPFRYRLSPARALLVQVKLTPSPFVWSFSLKLPITRTVPSHYANDFFVVLRCIEPVSLPTRYANGYS